MKALQRACTALSKENGKLEVSDTPAVFEPYTPFRFRAHVASRPPCICFHVGTILLSVGHINKRKKTRRKK
jgi:hypothetical protein